MQFSSALRRWPTRAVVAVAAASMLAACGGGDEPEATSPSGGESAAAKPVTLKVGLFGTMGFKESGLFDEYQKLNPNVKIDYTSVQQEQDYYTALQTRLTAGSGLADVQGIEVGRIAEVTATQGDKWADLKQFGGDKASADFYPWKVKDATTADGKILALGTDIGPQAICYRKDLFEAAGLPSDREAVSASWDTWDKYIAVGNQYKAKAAKGKAFVDSAGGVFNAITNQGEKKFYEGGNLVHETNPAVKSAWDTSVKVAQAGLSAKLQQFTKDWDAAFANGGFATIACPSWMIGYIQGKAGDAGKGKWDVASLPGGGGNWGGAYLAVPAKSKNQAEAYKLIEWLTAAAQAEKVFLKQGSFPSNQKAAESASVKAAKSEYMSGAPIGQIFGDSASKLVVQEKGPKDGVLQTSFTNALVTVEQRGKNPDQAWTDALKDIKQQIG